MKSFVTSLLIVLVFAGACFTVVQAGQNAGAQAWLSWNPTRVVSDTTLDLETINFVQLFVGLTHPPQQYNLVFQGAEIDLTWLPAADTIGDCFDHFGTSFSQVKLACNIEQDCRYLNRGTTTPTVTDDGVTHFHVLWTNTLPTTCCASGSIIRLSFGMSSCLDVHGCFSLNQVTIFDNAGGQDVPIVSNNVCTVDGGGSYDCLMPTPARHSTWGNIKAIYK